jgi:hypothetical protein
MIEAITQEAKMLRKLLSHDDGITRIHAGENLHIRTPHGDLLVLVQNDQLVITTDEPNRVTLIDSAEKWYSEGCPPYPGQRTAIPELRDAEYVAR